MSGKKMTTLAAVAALALGLTTTAAMAAGRGDTLFQSLLLANDGTGGAPASSKAIRGVNSVRAGRALEQGEVNIEVDMLTNDITIDVEIEGLKVDKAGNPFDGQVFDTSVNIIVSCSDGATTTIHTVPGSPFVVDEQGDLDLAGADLNGLPLPCNAPIVLIQNDTNGLWAAASGF